MSVEQEKIAAAAEFDDKTLSAPPPRARGPVRLSPNKAQASAFPDGELSHRVALVTLRPSSSKVLAYDKDGVPVARYSDPAQAIGALEKAGVKLATVTGGAQLLARMAKAPESTRTANRKDDR